MKLYKRERGPTSQKPNFSTQYIYILNIRYTCRGRLAVTQTIITRHALIEICIFSFVIRFHWDYVGFARGRFDRKIDDNYAGGSDKKGDGHTRD